MGEPSLKDKIADRVASLFWYAFLWAEGWSEDEYNKLRDEDAYRVLDTSPIAEMKMVNGHLWVRVDPFPEGRGAIRLMHEPECVYGNCRFVAPYGFVPEAGCPQHDV